MEITKIKVDKMRKTIKDQKREITKLRTYKKDYLMARGIIANHVDLLEKILNRLIQAGQFKTVEDLLTEGKE